MNKIVEINQKKIEALCQRFQVQALEIFGSAVRNDDSFDKSKSDIDLLVEFNDQGLVNYADNYFGLLEELENLFNCSVDLVVGSSVKNPYFLKNIQKDRAFLYAA